ncbi:MAG: glycosyltransferase family 39 protein [Candidatus Bathyarchaeota archaeon]|nr:glycosyltransferase family 39 protein [Candidatus Bathyarchaeota archaeon]
MGFLSQLKSQFDKWRILIFIFAAVYAVVLSYNLSNMAMQWDEVNHFTGGLLLIRGDLWNYFLTSSFYPPAFNLVTAGYFAVAGATVFAARLVALTFSTLSIIAVYELAKRMYGSKTALISALLFAVMPGMVWLSRIALIETMLIFVFTVCMLYFFKWIETNHERDLNISIACLAIGAAVKYQTVVVAPIIIIVGMLVFGRKNCLKRKILGIFKPPWLIATVTALAITAVALFMLYTHGLLNIMWFAIQTGTAERAVSSLRYPAPIFYLIETTWNSSNLHPVSLLLYATALAGIALFIFRREKPDKFLLLWFAAVYGVFTLIPNKEWRYIVLLFPVLAVSASALITTAFNKFRKTWRSEKKTLRKGMAKIAAVALIVFTSTGVILSCSDAYTWLQTAPPPLPIEQATAYAAHNLNPNQSLVVACPTNLLNDYMVWFYLNIEAPSDSEVWQYPKLAADAYTLNFNTTEFSSLCQQNNTRFVFLYENVNRYYFNTSITQRNVSDLLLANTRFNLVEAFGTEPHRIFVYSFA